jgi:hypothetical protein
MNGAEVAFITGSASRMEGVVTFAYWSGEPALTWRAFLAPASRNPLNNLSGDLRIWDDLEFGTSGPLDPLNRLLVELYRPSLIERLIALRDLRFKVSDDRPIRH